MTSVLGVLGTQETSCILIAELLERDTFDLFLPEFDKPWVIHLRETCYCSTNLCTWRPNTVYKNRSVRRHQLLVGGSWRSVPLGTSWWHGACLLGLNNGGLELVLFFLQSAIMPDVGPPLSGYKQVLVLYAGDLRGFAHGTPIYIRIEWYPDVHANIISLGGFKSVLREALLSCRSHGTCW
jgi:hypothetical protein